MSLTPQQKFGLLVAALRQERVYWERKDLEKEKVKTLDMKTWDQKKLANETHLSPNVIRNIEAGKKGTIGSDEIVALAKALNLTSQERIEFILAASFVENRHIVQTPHLGDKSLQIVIDRLKGTNLPLYISDVYGDVVAVNNVIMGLYNIPHLAIQYGLSEGVSRFNMLRFVFSKEVGFRKLLGERWETDVKSNVQYFRGESLRYRATKYWQATFKELLEIDDFQRVWQGIYFEEDNYMDIHPYSYMHPDHGYLSYFATVSTTITQAGNLRSVIYVPNDDNTHNAFDKIAHNSGNQIHRVATWPKEDDVSIN